MIKDDIVKYFLINSDSRNIPYVSSKNWKVFKEKYKKEDIRESLANYIVSNDVPFPIKKIPEKRLIDLFFRFCNNSMLEEYKTFDVVKERYDYKYKYSDKPLGVIDKSHTYNDVSDYFHQENRMRCGSNSSKSPHDIWKSEESLRSMNWIFWRPTVMMNKNLDEQTFRESFRLGTYTATQFKPSVAKAIYEKHESKNILDTSCGWGDRLAGFYGTHCTESYVGCDPNPQTFEMYKKQCIFYEKVLGVHAKLTEKDDFFICEGRKKVKIFRKPSEDVNWNEYENSFDMYFTSPPYFETERYASDTDYEDDQSWKRYSNFESWKNDFFFNVSHEVWETIKDDGFMMINIIEPRTKNSKRLNLCDDMVDTFSGFTKSNYLGKIGMRMIPRPNADEAGEVFIEPIWVFRKNNQKYLTDNKNTIENFLCMS